jgi:membrane-bound ClpP family serine protease
MSIGTMLLIGGALAIVLLMHHVGHAGHTGSHGAHEDGGSAVASAEGSGLVSARPPGLGAKADDPIRHGDHVGVVEESQAGAGQTPKKRGCC